MSDLYHLTAIPLPETPPYEWPETSITRSTKSISIISPARSVERPQRQHPRRPGQGAPDGDADLDSRRVDLTDLGGFIGATPGKASEAQTPQQKQEHAEAAASSKLLPDKPVQSSRSCKAADFG